MNLPHRFPDRDEIAAVRADAEKLEPQANSDPNYTLAGRVMGRRDLGKLVFLDLVDRSGQIQLLVQPVKLGAFDIALGDVVGVRGATTKTKRGEPSLSVTEFTLLAKIGDRSRTPTTASSTPRPATASATSTCWSTRTRAATSSSAASSSRPSAATSTNAASSRSRRRSCSRATEAPSPSRSSRIQTSSTPISTCASRPSSTSSA